MQRQERLLLGIDKSQLGIEIAPWLAPIAAKSDGYNVRILDILDRDALMALASADPREKRGVERLEEVDMVGSACDVADLVPAGELGTFRYIVSSHNFEHLPDPIRFLRGCEQVLAPGGLVSMVVPDKRACFDCFRPHTTIGEWLDAYREKRQKPTLRQWFDCSAGFAVHRGEEGEQFTFKLGTSVKSLHVTGDIEPLWRGWQDSLDDPTYRDTHCTVMTPASIELLLTEARGLGLLELEIESISESVRGEIFVRLVRPENGDRQSEPDLCAVRTRLMRQIFRENAAMIYPPRTPRSIARPLARRLRAIGRRLRGK